MRGISPAWVLMHLKEAGNSGGELPSPKGEGFVLRLKPVRVGPTADFRDPLLPSGYPGEARSTPLEGPGIRESISNSPTRALIESTTFPHPAPSDGVLRALPGYPGGRGTVPFPSPEGEGFADPLAGTLKSAARLRVFRSHAELLTVAS